MSLVKISAMMANLPRITNTTKLTLTDQIQAAYTNQIVTQLGKILSHPEAETFYLELESYLKDHWGRIKGTAMCYTATADNAITQLLCEVAEMVCLEKNRMDNGKPPKTPLEFLMPGLELESYHDHFKTLKAQPPAFSWNETEEDERLQLLNRESELAAYTLTEEEALYYDHLSNEVKGLQHEMNTGISSVVQQQRLNALKSELGELRIKKNNQLDLKKLNYLQQKKQAYQREQADYLEKDGWLFPNDTLADILSRSILSADLQSLIPVQVLLMQNLFNPYSDHYAAISASEKQRLRLHSPTTQALEEAREELERLKGEKNNLLGHVLALCRQLKMNDAHEGIGQQENAGSGAYPAIITFNDYYHRLSQADKESIPARLRQEIEKLLSLSSDPSKNKDATSNLDTCIGSRREQIELLVKDHALLLSQIACNESNQYQLIQIKEKEVSLAFHVLQDQLAKKSYQGKDVLPITYALLCFLNIQMRCQTLHDLHLMMSLSVDEIESLGYQAGGNVQMLVPIKKFEQFHDFVHATPSEKLTVFFKLTAPHLFNQLGQQGTSLLHLITSLTSEKAQLLLLQIKQSRAGNGLLLEYLFRLTDHPVHFMAGFNLLTSEEQLSLLLKKDAQGLTFIAHCGQQNPAVFEILFNLNSRSLIPFVLMPHAQAKQFLTAVMTQPASFEVVLSQLTKEELADVLTETDDAGNTLLHQVIHQEASFKRLAMHYENSQKRFEALMVKNHRHESVFDCLVNAGIALSTWSSLLSPEEFIRFLKLKDKTSNGFINHFVDDDAALKHILSFIGPNQLMQVVDDLSQEGSDVLHLAASEPKCIKRLLKLYPDSALLDVMKRKDETGHTLLHAVVDEPKAFKYVINRFAKKERMALLAQTNRQGESVVDYAMQAKNKSLRYLLKALPKKALKQLLTDARENQASLFHELVDNPTTLKDMLAHYPPQQRLAILTAPDEAGNSVLSKLIDSAIHFAFIIECLSPEHRLKAIQEKNQRGQTIFDRVTDEPYLMEEINKRLSKDDISDFEMKEKATPFVMATSKKYALVDTLINDQGLMSWFTTLPMEKKKNGPLLSAFFQAFPYPTYKTTIDNFYTAQLADYSQWLIENNPSDNAVLNKLEAIKAWWEAMQHPLAFPLHNKEFISILRDDPVLYPLIKQYEKASHQPMVTYLNEKEQTLVSDLLNQIKYCSHCMEADAHDNKKEKLKLARDKINKTLSKKQDALTLVLKIKRIARQLYRPNENLGMNFFSTKPAPVDLFYASLQTIKPESIESMRKSIAQLNGLVNGFNEPSTSYLDQAKPDRSAH